MAEDPKEPDDGESKDAPEDKPEAEKKAKADEKPKAEEKAKAKDKEEKDDKKPSSPWPSARKSVTSEASDPPPAAAKAAPAAADPEKAAWGAPLDKLDRAWTKLDSRLCAIVLVADFMTLVGWISLKALSNSGRGGGGMVFRCMLTALVFGVIAWNATKKHSKREHITTAATIAGLFLGSQWGDFGVLYFSNVLAWLQNASFLVFFGGASDIAKRLTLWLALLGASVATGQGKHINVDVVMRFLSPKARVPVAVLGWVAAAIVCFAGVWGFFDHVAVEDFRVKTSMPCPGDEKKMCKTPPGKKIDVVLHDTGRDLFLAGRQISLDFKALPKVLGGTPYGKWLGAKEWNEWLKGGGWEAHFKAEDVKALELDETSTDFRTPAVTSVPGENERIHQLLVKEFNFVFAFGLLVIALRFVIRSLLAISGWIKVDPNAAHGDEELAHAHDHSAQADAVEQAIKETVR